MLNISWLKANNYFFIYNFGTIDGALCWNLPWRMTRNWNDILALCTGNPLVTPRFPTQRANDAETVLWENYVIREYGFVRPFSDSAPLRIETFMYPMAALVWPIVWSMKRIMTKHIVGTPTCFCDFHTPHWNSGIIRNDSSYHSNYFWQQIYYLHAVSN